MHPLEKSIRDADGLVLIGDSSEGRFPGYSYNVYTQMGKPILRAVPIPAKIS